MKEVANCDLVTERIALGESLGKLSEHVETCAGCQRLVAVPSQFATAAERPDPGLGFSARMTIGAQQRLVVRRRRRIAGTAAAAVAACAIGVFAMTRSPSEQADRDVAGELPNPKDEKPIAIGGSDLAGLVRLADTNRARRVSAHWTRIQRPLAPYIKLVKGVDP